jgi:hypothetical protein
MPGSGLAVWHIDETGGLAHAGSDWAKVYECRLLQADGYDDLGTESNAGDPGDLFSTTTATELNDDTHPSARWKGGSPSGIDIHDIGAAGPVMSFRVRHPRRPAVKPASASAPAAGPGPAA